MLVCAEDVGGTGEESEVIILNLPRRRCTPEMYHSTVSFVLDACLLLISGMQRHEKLL